MKKWLLVLAVFTLTTILAACSEDDATEADAAEKKELTVGTSPGPYSELFINAIQPILEDQGYKIKAVDFTELRQADIALADGGVDFNVDQHTAYMENFNGESGSTLTALTPIPTVPAALFPGAKKVLEDVAEGDVVAIPQDPSNAARAYALLQKAGWIKIKEGVELIKATAADIEENKYNLDIVEMDSAQIPRTIDEFAYAVIPGSMVYAAGIDPNVAILAEDVLENYRLVLVVDKKNENTQWAKDITAAYKSAEFKKYLEENNDSGYWFIPEELK